MSLLSSTWGASTVFGPAISGRLVCYNIVMMLLS